MKPTINSLWKYLGPGSAPSHYDIAPRGQIHKVIYSHADEVITIGIPAGRGGTWLGPAADFQSSFTYVGEASETSC